MTKKAIKRTIKKKVKMNLRRHLTKKPNQSHEQSHALTSEVGTTKPVINSGLRNQLLQRANLNPLYTHTHGTIHMLRVCTLACSGAHKRGH